MQTENLQDNGASEVSTEQVSSTNEAVNDQSQLDSNQQNASVEAVQPYNPNYKFKVLDKEMEFDEFVRGSIKDADTEKKIRELYEKAYGLDSIKPKHEALKEKVNNHYSKIESEHTSLTNTINLLDKMLQQGDIDNFLSALEIPEETFLKWAVKKAQLMELTPDKREEYNRSVAERNRLYQLEQQNQAFQEQFFESQVQARTTQLDNELFKPEVAQVAASFDARAGRQGAFREEVIKRGQFAWTMYQKDIPVEQAVKEVMLLVGNTIPQQQQASVNGVAQSSGQPQVVPPKPNVIPNIQGQASTPVKKKFKSLDEMKQYANSLGM